MQAIQAFLEQNQIPLTLDKLFTDPRQRPSALCYLRRGSEVLMLQRVKEPFAGFWTAPGGKLEPGEDPAAGACREIWEETDLRVTAPRLRVITSETGGEHYNWVLFMFVCDDVKGRVGETDEGVLAWLPKADLMEQPIPEIDRLLLPYVLEEPEEQIYYASVAYDDSNEVAGVHVQPIAPVRNREWNREPDQHRNGDDLTRG